MVNISERHHLMFQPGKSMIQPLFCLRMLQEKTEGSDRSCMWCLWTWKTPMTGYQGRYLVLLLLLFLWLVPSSGVAAMVVDRLFPVSPVSFIALSQSYSLHVPLAHILPPCLWSPSLPFPGIAFVITLLTT